MIPTKPKMQQQLQRVPGIRCPHCGNLIPTSIQLILFSSSLFCPTCGLKLNIDKRKSDKALEMIKKVEDAQKRVEETSHFSK
jgi:DNA-directed RNA polymerase subunit RPC12/RpoP